LFSFIAQNISLHALLAFKVFFAKSAAILMAFLYILFVFLSYKLQNSFLIFCANFFDNNMHWWCSVLVMSVWHTKIEA
jgi:hypothetical protein